MALVTFIMNCSGATNQVPEVTPARALWLPLFSDGTVSREDMVRAYTQFRSRLKRVTIELKAEWRKAKGNLVAAFGILTLTECLDNNDQDPLLVTSILSEVLFSDFVQMVSNLPPTTAAVHLVAFKEYCNNMDPKTSHANFETFVEKKEVKVCAALSIGDRYGANKIIKLKSLKSFKASFPNFHISFYFTFIMVCVEKC
jgi:hypothetical protein